MDFILCSLEFTKVSKLEENVSLTINFEKSGKISVSAPVREMAMNMAHMPMGNAQPMQGMKQ